MKVVEGVMGYYFYHLSETGKNGQITLCGTKQVMQTGIPVSAWGAKSHLNEKWCEKCWKIYQRKGEKNERY